mgnify:CR=1 FL=1
MTRSVCLYHHRTKESNRVMNERQNKGAQSGHTAVPPTFAAIPKYAPVSSTYNALDLLADMFGLRPPNTNMVWHLVSGWAAAP